MEELKKIVSPDNISKIPLKPVVHIKKLSECLEPFSNNFATNEKQKISYMESGEREIYILNKGSVALHRSSDNMVLNSESAPFIFGISNQLTTPEYLFIRTQEASNISRLSLSKANYLIAKNNLWESLAKVLIYTIARVYDHCAKISHLSSYEVIRYQLYELNNENDEIKKNITAANYIQSRTFLSRSGTMRILSELKTGGYITLDKGILTGINLLPLKY